MDAAVCLCDRAHDPIYLKFGGRRRVSSSSPSCWHCLRSSRFFNDARRWRCTGDHDMAAEQSQAVLLGTGLVISVVLLLVSYGVSVRILRKKEF
ncbi:MAG: hypothetical protein ACLVJ6_05925 [Merdibacter sp.]